MVTDRKILIEKLKREFDESKKRKGAFKESAPEFLTISEKVESIYNPDLSDFNKKINEAVQIGWKIITNTLAVTQVRRSYRVGEVEKEEGHLLYTIMLVKDNV